MNEPLLTIIACTYGHSIHQLRIFLDSLMVQTDPRWVCYLLHDGPPAGDINRLICDEYYETGYHGQSFWDEKTGELSWIKPLKIHIKYSKERKNQFGHDLREWGLNEFANTKYLMFQNADNYLIPKAVEGILKTMEPHNLDLCLFNILHNYAGHLWGDPDYVVLDTKPQTNYCDIGSFAIKTELAKKVGFPWRMSHADGVFIEEVMRHKPVTGKISKSVLMVHN